MTNYNDIPIEAQVAEVKEALSAYLVDVSQGKTVTIVKGKNRVPIARIVPIEPPKKRKLNFGGMSSRGPVVFADDWEMTEEEFINL